MWDNEPHMSLFRMRVPVRRSMGRQYCELRLDFGNFRAMSINNHAENLAESPFYIISQQ
jgi:hypothetical protein